jgi:hypothetical protein
MYVLYGQTFTEICRICLKLTDVVRNIDFQNYNITGRKGLMGTALTKDAPESVPHRGCQNITNLKHLIQKSQLLLVNT